MRKAIILSAMALFAINIVSVQHANAQVNKQREQFLQSAVGNGNAGEQVDPAAKDTSSNTPNIQVDKQRELVIQNTKKKNLMPENTDNPGKPNAKVIKRDGPGKKGSKSMIQHNTNDRKRGRMPHKKQNLRESTDIQDTIHQGPGVSKRVRTAERVNKAPRGKKNPVQKIEE